MLNVNNKGELYRNKWDTTFWIAKEKQKNVLKIEIKNNFNL